MSKLAGRNMKSEEVHCHELVDAVLLLVMYAHDERAVLGWRLLILVRIYLRSERIVRDEPNVQPPDVLAESATKKC
jgi:hypothetical protein